MAKDKPCMQFVEHITDDIYVTTVLKRVLFQGKSKFQDVQIVETIPHGKMLVLDHHTQSASSDEANYHESLVHPALLSHPCPRSVFIGGGGEGATAREILKHSTVERVVMVDIDEQVCKICEKEMPEWGAGAWSDPRFTVHYEDAKAWLENTTEKFDVIIMDISDPIEAGPGWLLYTKEFYETTARKCLGEHGLFVTQSGAGSVLQLQETFSVLNKTLNASFDGVYGYVSEVPSFGDPWGFHMCWNGNVPTLLTPETDEETVDKRIAERLPNHTLKYYDGVTHRHIFSLPKPLRTCIEREDRIFTEKNPIYMF